MKRVLSYVWDLLLIGFPFAVRLLLEYFYRMGQHDYLLYWEEARVDVPIVVFAIYGVVLACRSLPRNAEKQRRAFRYRMPYLVIAIVACVLSFFCDSYVSLAHLIYMWFGKFYTLLLEDTLYAWPLVAGYGCVWLFHRSAIKPGSWRWLIVPVLLPIATLLFDNEKLTLTPTLALNWQLLFESIVCLISGVCFVIHRRRSSTYKAENPWYLLVLALLSVAACIGFVFGFRIRQTFGAMHLWSVLIGYFLAGAIAAWKDSAKTVEAESIPSAP